MSQSKTSFFASVFAPIHRLTAILALGLAAAFCLPATAGAATDVASSFTEVNKRTKGTWSIESRADGQYVVLSDDFKTRGAPDLKIFLSPKQAGDLTDRNATDGSLFVAKLTSNRGSQSYKLPAGVNVDDYASFLIHCEQFSKFWAAGDL